MIVAGSSRVEKAIVDIQETLTRFERDIRLLKIEFDRYFNGFLDIPPEDNRGEVEETLRQLRGQPLNSFADRYRLNSLEARFNSFNALWTRKLRKRESAAGRPTTSDRGPDPYAGLTVGNGPSRTHERALYEELYRSSDRSAKTDFDSFRRFLRRQTEKIRGKTGCSEVRFRIASQDGKLTLKAQPVNAESTEDHKR